MFLIFNIITYETTGHGLEICYNRPITEEEKEIELKRKEQQKISRRILYEDLKREFEGEQK